MTYEKALKKYLNSKYEYVFFSFINSISLLILLQTNELCKQDVPVVEAFGNEKWGGKGIEKPSIEDIADVLDLKDFSRHISLTSSMMNFFEWLFKQKVDEDSTDDVWYGPKTLIDKWNEFADKNNM